MAKSRDKEGGSFLFFVWVSGFLEEYQIRRQTQEKDPHSAMATTNKGLIFLDSKCGILHELLQPRVLEGKREACEINFGDFDDAHYRVACDPATPNIVQVHLAIHNAQQLKSNGSKEVMDRVYPGMEIPPAAGFNVAIQFDCDALPGPAEQFLNTVSELRRNMMAGPLDKAFSAMLAKTSSNLPITTIEYRAMEPTFIVPTEGKIIVVFAVDFADITDKALARVFLQEFVE
eukprot:gene45807-56063_t